MMTHITFITRKGIKNTLLFYIAEEISQVLFSSYPFVYIRNFLISVDGIYFTFIHRKVKLVRHHCLVLADLLMCLLPEE